MATDLAYAQQDQLHAARAELKQHPPSLRRNRN
jgi:hypothetical protein